MNALCIQIQEEKNPKKFEGLLRELNDVISYKRGRLKLHYSDSSGVQRTKPWKMVPAVVNKLIEPKFSGQVQRIEISIPSADELFREIRIENSFNGPDGKPVALRNGANLDVTLEADNKDDAAKVPERFD